MAMRLNPYINAVAASSYICMIGAFFRFMNLTQSDKPDTIMAPMIALSLLVFSVALMAFLFFYYPLILLLENKRDQAVSFFLKTLGTFFIFVLVLLASISIQ